MMSSVEQTTSISKLLNWSYSGSSYSEWYGKSVAQGHDPVNDMERV